MYRLLFKRLIDTIVSLLLLILLSPIFLFIVILSLIVNRGNPFYFQIRPGLNREQFKIVKFKSMNDKRDANGKLLPDKYRTTRFGKVLRKTSLDELPQLLNVIKGDMSLVGPRPLLFDYILLYQPGQERRHEVRPGITGWAQVNGRNAISWTKKFEYDVWYVDNISFIIDFKIILLTIMKVINRSNVDFIKLEGEKRFNGYN